MGNEAGAARASWWRITPAFARSRGLFLIGVVAAALFAGNLGADSFWFLELPLHFHLQMLIVVLASMVVLAWGCWHQLTRLDVLILVIAFLTASWLAGGLWRWLPAQQALIPPAVPDDAKVVGKLRLLSLNVFSGNKHHDEVLELIRREDADVVFLMELTSPWAKALLPLGDSYTFCRVKPDDSGNSGIGLWSKLPVRSFEYVNLGSIVPQIHAVLEVGGQPVRFLGVHPLPPRTGWYANERNKNYQGIMKLLSNSPPLPCIVAGDLNSTRFAPRFLQLCREAKLHDASYPEVVGRTWPVGPVHWIMGIRIDHVLVGPGWRVREFSLGPDVGSDHYSLVAEVELTER